MGDEQMKLSRLVTAAALSAVAGLAVAGPENIGTGPGDYTFSGSHDLDFFVLLAPGSYQISGSVQSQGFLLTDVFFSTTKFHNPFFRKGGTIDLFDRDAPNAFSDAPMTVTFTDPTSLYLNVNTTLGKLVPGGSFTGELKITPLVAVPEPASSALLLAGIGLLGFMGLRRKR
jgi:hypothetical protein